jgi:hypothetical protein
MKFSIRVLYLYLFSFIGLLVAVIGAIQLVNLGLQVYVFQNADQYSYAVPVMPAGPDGKDRPVSPETAREQQEQQKLDNRRQRQRTTSNALAMMIIGIPLYLYHWRMISREG